MATFVTGAVCSMSLAFPKASYRWCLPIRIRPAACWTCGKAKPISVSASRTWPNCNACSVVSTVGIYWTTLPKCLVSCRMADHNSYRANFQLIPARILSERDAEQFLLREQKRAAQRGRETEATESKVSADSDIITRDDTSDHKQQYDAFILFADADIEFASKMVDKLEARGLQLCLRDRDILGGSNFEHEVISRLISERCRRVVVIISKAFLASPLNDFTVTFAQALQIEQKARKVIPCVYDRCELPPHLRYTCRLDYQRSQNLYNFWDKLAESIRDTPRKVGLEVSGRELPAPQKPPVHSKPVELIGPPQPLPKVVVEQPPLVVKLPSAAEQDSRTGSLKKSHSFWDIFSNFGHKKDKLNGSTSQLNLNEMATPLPSPKKVGSSPLALIRRDKKQPPAASASSAPSACPLDLPPVMKPVKSKKKWYKPGSRKLASAV